jgi:hypothetical protein
MLMARDNSNLVSVVSPDTVSWFFQGVFDD